VHFGCISGTAAKCANHPNRETGDSTSSILFLAIRFRICVVYSRTCWHYFFLFPLRASLSQPASFYISLIITAACGDLPVSIVPFPPARGRIKVPNPKIRHSH
jgi:hypothetical protein